MRKGTQYTIDDYIITKDGKVINRHNGHISIPQKNSKGYLRVNIGHTLKLVHRLVAEKYIPNPENKPQVNHIDGNKSNNSVENLEWCTNMENRKHAIENGLHLCGDQCSYSKLTEEIVLEIRQIKNPNFNELSLKYNIKKNTLRDAYKGRTWKQLKSYAEL